ncbi:hypothetical protein pb186bvf_005259 [Paramecium bursaria]
MGNRECSHYESGNVLASPNSQQELKVPPPTSYAYPMLFDEYNLQVDALSYEIKDKMQSIQPKKLHTDKENTSRPYYLKRQNFIYVGQWKNKKPNGIGHMLKEDWYYYGEFKDGLPNGQGIKILTDGSSFEDGDLTGLGKFESEYKVYEGEFYRSIQHGFGKENQFGEEYNGEFKYGSRNGDGTLEWKGDRYFIQFHQQFRINKNKRRSDSRIYKGQFKDGMMHGIGVYQWKQNKFIGIFYKNRMDGAGSVRIKNINYEGIFSNDILQSKLIRIQNLMPQSNVIDFDDIESERIDSPEKVEEFRIEMLQTDKSHMLTSTKQNE